MVFPEVPGQFKAFLRLKQRKMAFNKLLKIIAEISQEKLVISRTEQNKNVVVIIFYVLQQMKENRLRASAVENMSVVMSGVAFRVEYMAEKLFAVFLEQKILGFKMGVKGGSAYVGALNNFSHRYLIEVFTGKQFGEGRKNSLPCFPLSSVHVAVTVHFLGFVQY